MILPNGLEESIIHCTIAYMHVCVTANDYNKSPTAQVLTDQPTAIMTTTLQF